MSALLRSSAPRASAHLGSRELDEIHQAAGRLRALGTGAFAASYGELLFELPPLCPLMKAPELARRGLAHACEALRRVLEIELYDEQLSAAWQLIRGTVAEVQTGEGKTFAVAAASWVLALSRRPIHVMTANSYLAERDQALIAPAAAQLGLTVRALPLFPDEAGKARAYAANILYGTSTEIGFDYLRHDLTERTLARRPLGTGLLEALRGERRPVESPFHLDHAIALIDEADQVLLDDATVPLILAEQAAPSPTELHWIRRADDLVSGWMEGREFQRNEIHTTVSLAENAVPFVDDPEGTRSRPWSEYVQRSVEARHLLERDRDYLVQKGEIVLLDRNTGRRLPGHRWQAGLHEAVEVAEGLESRGAATKLASITRPRLLRLYGHLAGTTGTASGAARELEALYRLPVQVVPPHFPERRQQLTQRTFVNRESKLCAIVTEAAQRSGKGQPVLIGTRTIADGEWLAMQLSQRGVPAALLTGKQDADEAGIVARAGSPGMVTLTTGLAGRGTDIPVPAASLSAGGLHVIVAERQHSSRIDRQLVGRCARQGQPGSTQTFASADDWLIRRFSPRVAAWIHQQPQIAGEIRTPCERRSLEAQRRSESWSAEQRRKLLAADLARADLCLSLETGSGGLRQTA